MKKLLAILEKKCLNHDNVEMIIEDAYKQKIGPLVSAFFMSNIKDLSNDITGNINERLSIFYNQVDLRLKYADEIETIFTKNSITPIFVKGFVLSQMIYDTPYGRQHGDIDILVDNKSQIAACELATEISFEESYAKAIAKNINITDAKMYYLGDCWEKEFVRHTKDGVDIYIEIKDYRTRLNTTMSNNLMNHLYKCTINEYEYTTLDEIYSYLYLINTAYDNFTDEGSFGRENTVRDLYDIMNFTNKMSNRYNLLEEAKKVCLEKEFILMLLLTDRVFDSFDLKGLMGKYNVNLYDLYQGDVRNELDEIYHNMLLFKKNYYDEAEVCNNLRSGSNTFVHQSIIATAFNENLYSRDASKPCLSTSLEQPRCYLSPIKYGIKYGALYTESEIIHYISFDADYKSFVVDLGILSDKENHGYQKSVFQYCDKSASIVNNEADIHDLSLYVDSENHCINISFMHENKHPKSIYFEYLYLLVYIDKDSYSHKYRPIASLGKRENNNDVYYPVKLRIGRY